MFSRFPLKRRHLRRGFLVLFAVLTLMPVYTVQAQQKFSFDEWLMIGPIPTIGAAAEPGDEKAQKAFLEANQVDPMWLKDVEEGQIMPMGQARIQWQRVKAEDGMVDIGEFYGGEDAASVNDYAAAFLYAQVDAQEAQAIALGVGSDDALRIWVNGELVHDKWTARQWEKHDDFLPIQLRAGTNRILAKVQNKQGEWAFSMHQLTEKEVTGILNGEVIGGDLDDIERIIASGHNVNATIDGIAPWHIAQIAGRTRAAELLEEGGAVPSDLPPAQDFADYFFNEAVENENGPGCSWLVYSAEHGLVEGTRGMANVKKERAITTNTVFRIGSISKQFTAVGILLLVEEGKVKLDSKLSEFVPDFPRGEEVTITHLLTHTSGIVSYTDMPDFMERVTEYMPIAELVNEIKGHGYAFDPGKSWAYNNSGYMLLGYIIEQVSGQSLAEYWKEKIFTPLGMTRSGVYDNKRPPKEEAIGYSWGNGTFELSKNWDMSWAGAAGNIYSTPSDLLKWNQALWSNKVLKEETLKRAHTPATLNDGSQANAFGMAYGFGWLLSDFRGLEVIEHSGGLNGFHSQLAYYPEHGMTIVVLNNSLPGHRFSATGAGQTLSEIWLHPHMEKALVRGEETTLSAEQLGDYVGNYKYPGGMLLTVRQEEDHLMAKVSFQDALQIYSSGVDTFFWKAVEATVIFLRDDEGRVESVRHLQGGQDFVAPKMAQRSSIDIPVEALAKYEGVYLMRGMELKVAVKDGSLTVQPPGQPALQLLPASETSFFLEEIDGGMEFTLGDNGEVVQAKMRQGDMEFQADPKKEVAPTEDVEH